MAKPICPQCGHTWIDTNIGEELPPLTPETVAAANEPRAAAAPPTPDLPEQQRRRPWAILLGAALAITVVLIGYTIINGDNGDTDQATATTAPAVTETTEATPAPTTTEATTTTAPTTTTSTTTTSTTTTTTLPPIEPEGTAIATGDLTLGAFALGPFGFNDSGEYLGRLVASLGQPTSRTEGGEDLGLCSGEAGVAYGWDGFSAIFEIDGDRELFIGYRLDDTDSDHPSQTITSRSGLALGDTISRLEAIYLQSGLAFVDIDGKTNFVLLRSSDSATLLWGPVSSGDPDGIVEGIYSPRACDGGPSGTQ